MSHHWTVIRLALSLSLLSNAAIAVDQNSNGLSDVWEQRFNASALELLNDDDGDGFTNVEECIVGTDPEDATDLPKLFPSTTQNNPDQIELRFQTLSGKHYSVPHSQDLSGFAPITHGWQGDNSERALHINTDGIAETLSPIRIDYWADFAGTTIAELHALNSFPSAPDGSSNHLTPEAPDFLAIGYGARLSCWITPPESGSYTFFLSASGPAELYLHDSSSDSAPVKIAEILPTQTDLARGEWDTYSTQRSTLLELAADSRYALELHYVANVPQQYVEIAWSGPSIEGIQLLDRDALAKVFFHNQLGPQNILLQHDYDSDGQTGTQWPDNTAIVTGTVGMTGNAEHITGDVGTSSTLERIHFDPGSSQHFYATWLFNMSNGLQDTYLYFMNGNDSGQEGPRIDIEDSTSNDTGAVVRAGGSGGSDAQVDIDFGKTYRIEIITSLAVSGFEYKTPNDTHTVAEDTFDLYVTDLTGNLVGSYTGLDFRDGPGVVETLSSLRLPGLRTPNIVFDDWEITNGLIAGNGYLVPNKTDFGNGDTSNFFELEIKEQDQDNDGIPDWEELALAPYYAFLPFDAETTNGTADADALALLLAQSQGKPEITLYGSDAAAFESNYPNTTPDHGEITITRVGTLEPLTVELCFPPLEAGTSTTLCDGTCCMLIGSAGDEAAEPEDYILTDQYGNVVTDTVHFAFGEIKKVLTLTAVDDTLNEYPESVNIAIKEADDARYDISEIINGASIQLFDLPENPDNVTIFTGSFSQDGKAVFPTNGSGFATATINGPRTEIRLWDEFSGLTSAQQDSHVHKANAGNTPGNIIYAITETPGDDETDPLNGALTNYLWDLTDSSGAIPTAGGPASKQIIIDSLFGQNDESPLYLNVHTVDNPAGEIWAFLNLSGGSSSDPGDPTAAPLAGSADYPQLSGDLLESEVSRFLNQATFGATDATVAALVTKIEAERLSNPAYHRNQAYTDWIDEQMNPASSPQTYLLELTLADYFQMATLAGIFDSTLNPTDGITSTPLRPTTWPTIDRSDPNPEHWHLSKSFTFNDDQLDLADDNNLRLSNGNNERRHAHWQTMLNANDQLRQKMGYALQQIVVVSASATTIRNNAYGSANYQDMLNTHAFNYYRDILGFANWSPIMGKWLSSLQNQKAIDFDGDGLFDSYPDENLARENMQLFSIGLFQIWPDGTLKLSPEGLPQPTYTNDDIREFAKILTGQSFSQYKNYDTIPTWGGVDFVADNEDFDRSQSVNGPLARSYLYPMKMFGDYHSLGSKTFAGVTIDNTNLTDPTEQGIADIERAVDWLAGVPGDGKPDFDMVNSHVSTPGFIARRLIQRFTTSNPSQDYLHRVATVFKESEGNLGLTLKALLLDPEARALDLNDTVFGMKKSPLEGYLQMLRSLEAYSYIPLTNPEGAVPYDQAPGDYSNPDLYLESFEYPSGQLANFERNVRFMNSLAYSSGSQGLQMDPFRQPTVFNFYLPDFSPGGATGNAGLVAPEFQLANEPDIIRNINYFHDIIRYEPGPGADELGNSDKNQNLAFGFSDTATDANNHDQPRLPLQVMADAYYPEIEPTSGITTEASGTTESVTGTRSATTPHWVRLSRSGDVFIASESIDGLNWTEISIQILPMASEVFIGLAVTSHDDGILTTAEFSNVALTGSEGTWYSDDIGSVSAAGSTSETGVNTFTIQASGNDIWNSADELHFAYQLLDGDGEITARVDSLILTNPWAKGGVMIRETLAANSANVTTLVSGSYGTRAQIRRVPRGRSSESIADEALVDELDRRLTNGLFKLRYPYDTSDNDDPNIHGVDERLKNPREWIIDSITGVYGNPYDSDEDAENRKDKLENALYLLTYSPEYQIKK